MASTSSEAAAPSSSVPDREHRRGVLAGTAAYAMWGIFPLVFHQLQAVGAGEILLHRIIWSFVVVVVGLFVFSDRGWIGRVRQNPRVIGRLAVAAVLIAVNWLVYIWAVNTDRVVEAALGYYINPLITVGLGVVVLRERLRRPQVVALAFGAAAVVVMGIAYGRVPWIALVLACTFAGYGFVKKAVDVDGGPSLAVETSVLLLPAIVALVVLEARGDAAFLHGSIGQDALLMGLGVVTAAPLVLFGVAATRIPLTVLGLLQYLTPTLQLICGVVILHEPLPPERLAGFVLVWIALGILGADAVRAYRTHQDHTLTDVAAEPPP
jgi:chloramphenicol-sensitive protein RarD